MIIKTWRDPYDSGFTLTTPKEIDMHPGLTVLVGCNGAGKTTLLMNIKEELKNNDIPHHSFNNLRDGGTNDLGALLSGYGGDVPSDTLATGLSLWTASEGEAIKINLNRQSTLYNEFFKTGYFKNRQYRFNAIFDDNAEKIIESNIRVLLFDATDSGLSIDAVCEIKALFKQLINDTKEMGIELYIIISANEYELCRHENCFDVNKGEYVTFIDYEAYRTFIINSRHWKEKRIKKQIKWQENKKAKELKAFLKLKEKLAIDKEKILKKKENGQNLSWKEDGILKDRPLREFIRNSHYLTEDLLNEENNDV